MYLLLPLESFTSLLKTNDISKRKRCLSRPFRISVFGSHTWKDSWRMSSPWDSMFSSKPKKKREKKSPPGGSGEERNEKGQTGLSDKTYRNLLMQQFSKSCGASEMFQEFFSGKTFVAEDIYVCRNKQLWNLMHHGLRYVMYITHPRTCPRILCN